MIEKEKAGSPSIVIEDTPATKKKIKRTQVCRIKGMRQDVKRSLALVSRYLLKKPDAKNAELQRELGLGLRAVTTARANMAEYVEKDDRIMALTERDLEIVWVGQEEIMRRMRDKEEMKKIKTVDLANAMEKSEKRYMLFRGDATNKEGGLKTIGDIIIE